MKVSRTVEVLLCGLLLALCFASEGFTAEYQADYISSINALARGEAKEFLSAMEATASVAEGKGNWSQAAAAYNEASWVAERSGQLQKAVSYATKALEWAGKGNDPTPRARAIFFLAISHGSLRQYAKAREWIETGLGATKRIPIGPEREAYEGLFYRLLGSDYLRTGDLEKGIENLSYSLSVQESRLSYFQKTSAYVSRELMRGAQFNVLLSLNSLASAYQRAGRLEEAIKTYESGIALVKKSGLKSYAEGNLYQGLGQVYLRQKDYPRALEILTKALQLAEAQSQATSVQTTSRAIGDLYRQTQRPSEAVGYYRKAIENIESTRSLLTSGEYRQSFFEGGLAAYVSMVGALLDSGKTEEAFNYSEHARSRVFLDVLGSKVQLSRAKGGLLEEERALQERIAAIKARLSSDEEGEADRGGLRKQLAEAEQAYSAFLAKVRTQDKEQSSLMSVEPLTLKRVQELLDPETTLIEYFVTGPVTYVWVVDKDKVDVVRVELPREKLSSLVKTLRDSIFAIGEREKFGGASAALHKQLIEPVLPHITGKELIIVPHDVLHYLPFHALLSPDGKYLIEKFPIYYLSSASLLQFTKEKRRAGKADKVLALGNPDLGDPRMNLQFAELEAKEIQGLYPQSTVLLKREATEGQGKALSPQHDIIHFATHAELDENDPLSSAVLLTKDGKEDGRLEVREIFGMDLKASLVVLSACETGLGKLSSGDELVGLTRAFIYAGTPSVVASLWNVEDSSTAALMASFYKNLKTMSKVEALRQAQLNLIRGNINSDLLARRGIGGVGKLGETPAVKTVAESGDAPMSVSTSHPYFWAPFILVGDGK